MMAIDSNRMIRTRRFFISAPGLMDLDSGSKRHACALSATFTFEASSFRHRPDRALVPAADAAAEGLSA